MNDPLEVGEWTLVQERARVYHHEKKVTSNSEKHRLQQKVKELCKEKGLPLLILNYSVRELECIISQLEKM